MYSHRRLLPSRTTLVLILAACSLIFGLSPLVAQDEIPTDPTSPPPATRPIPTTPPLDVPDPGVEPVRDPGDGVDQPPVDDPVTIPTRPLEPPVLPVAPEPLPPMYPLEPDLALVARLDFDGGDTSGWQISNNAQIASTDYGNAGLLAAGETIKLAALTNLGDQRIDLRFNAFTAPLATEALPVTDGLSIIFRERFSTSPTGDRAGSTPSTDSRADTQANGPQLGNGNDLLLGPIQEAAAYAVTLTSGEVALYRNGGAGYELMTYAPLTVKTSSDRAGSRADAVASTGTTWRNVTITARGAVINVLVDDALVLTYTDAAPLVMGETSFIANDGGAVLVDDIALYSYVNPMPVAAATDTPDALQTALQTKTGSALAGLVQAHINEAYDTAGDSADAFYMERDDAGRLRLLIWGAPGINGAQLASNVEALGGTVWVTGADYVEVYVSLDHLIPLLVLDSVRAVTLPERAVSNSAGMGQAGAQVQTVNLRTGSVIPHSLDILGVNSWHTYTPPGSAVPVLGQNVDMAVIDTGFVTTGANADDRACLGSADVNGGAGSATNGIALVEVICDIAPEANVYMHRASNASDLEQRITEIGNGNPFPVPSIIVIAIDPGAVSGTLETAILNLINTREIVVIASAGDTGSNGALTTLFNGGTSTFTLTASAGSVISYEWQDSANTGFNVASRLLGGEQVLDTRPVRGGTPSHQYVVPAGCGGSCQLTLEVNGDVATEIHVRVMGSTVASVNADASMTVSSLRTVTGVSQIDEVLSVGAVCPNQSSSVGRYRILPQSSIGDDTANTANIKPNMVAPSRVSTSTATAQPDCVGGADGTSVAAAHVAGMIALMYSHPQISEVLANDPVGVPLAVRTYLQTRTIDLAFGATPFVPNGYDNVYGAGLVQLGNPAFNLNLDQQLGDASQDILGAIDPVYVASAWIPFDPADPDTSVPADGTSARPYNSIGYALEQAVLQGRDTVVLMPGEYVSGFAVYQSDIRIVSYDAVDQFERPASNIWANETYLGIAAIYLGGIDGQSVDVDSVTIEGLDFYAATPIYNIPGTVGDPTLNINWISPMYIGYGGAGSLQPTTNISIVDTTFNNFDGPMRIFNADGVTLMKADFNDFNISAPNQVPVFDVAALDIRDSGDTLGVTVQGRFNGNILPTGLFTNSTTWQEPVVGIRRSKADVISSRFEFNQTESVIAINQWISEVPNPAPSDIYDAGPITIYNTLFNTNGTFDVADERYELKGALVQIYQNADTRFLNNSVVNHVLTDGVLGNLFTIGHVNTLFLQVTGHRFEIHNNLFYNNDVEGNFLEDASDVEFINVGCAQFGSPETADNGATFNWFAPALNSGGGECSDSIGISAAPSNSNVYTQEWPLSSGNLLIDPSDPDSAISAAARELFVQQIFFNTFDPRNPWRLRPPELDDMSVPLYDNPGVDVASNAEVLEYIGTYDPLIDFDLFGAPRIIDRTPPIDPISAVVDAGAYELANPEPVTIGIDPLILTPVDEDTEAVIFNIAIDADIQDGYQPYDFDFTPPLVYDPNPFNVCQGEPILFNPDTNNVTYCPPEDFYTTGAPPEAQLQIEYTVSGLLGTGQDTGSFELVINPLDDGVPTVEDERQIYFTEGGIAVDVSLRPSVSFANGFVLSDPDDDNNPATPANVDYPFAYSNWVLNPDSLGPDQHNPNLFDTATLNAALLNAETTGVLNILPVAGEFGGFEIGYDVADADAQSAPGSPARKLRIIVTERLATVGLHDDASIDWVYSDLNTTGINGWLAFNYEPAINGTLHYTGTTGTSADFFFVGDGFALNLLGYPGAANYTVQLDLQDGSGFQDPRDIPGVTCSQQGTLSASIAYVGNFTFGCSGLATVVQDSVTTLRLTTASTGGLALDAIQVRGPNLGPGIYEEIDFALTYNGAWSTFADPTASNGAVIGATTASSSVSFTVDGDTVDALLLNRTTYTGSGSFEIALNGAVVDTVSSDSPYFYWDTPYYVGGIGNGPVNVTITNTQAGWNGFDSIELLGPSRRPLTQGFYTLDESRIDFKGDWYQFADFTSATGYISYSLQEGAAIVFTVDGTQVNRLTVHHAPWGGQIRVCGASCVVIDTTIQATTISLSDLGVAGRPAAVVSVSNETITGTQFVGLDQIQLWNSSTSLGAGEYLEYHPSLQYSDGTWNIYADVGAVGGSTAYAITGGALLGFDINTNQINRVALLHSNWGGSGQLCRNAGTFATPVITNCQNFSTANSRASIFTTDALGLTDPIESLILVIDNSSGSNWVGVEGFYLFASEALGPGEYPYSDGALDYAGTWLTSGTEGLPGLRYDAAPYNLDPLNGGHAVGFSVDTALVDRITVYHMDWETTALSAVPAPAQMQICRDLDNTCTTFTLNDRQETFTVGDLGLTEAVEGVTLRVVSGYAGVEGIALAGPATALVPGLYQETDGNLNYEGNWDWIGSSSFVDAATTDSSLTYAVSNGATVSFLVDATQVDQIAVLHGNWLGTGELCRNTNDNCQSFTADDYGEVFQASDLGLVGASELVTLRANSNWIGLDAIQLISGDVGLPPGTYEYDDIAMNYAGVWAEYNDSTLRNGIVRYVGVAGPSVSFPIDATQVTNLRVFHTAWLGTLDVCGGASTNCQTVTTDSRSSDITVADLGLSGAEAWVTINTTGGFVGFEGVQLLNGGGTLAPGLYQDTDARLTFDGSWTPFDLSTSLGGTVTYSNSSSAYISFTVDATTSDSVTVHHADWGTDGQLCVGDASPTNCQTLGTNNLNATTVDFATLGISGAAEVLSVRAGTGFLGFEALRINGAPAPIGPGYYEESASGIFLDAEEWAPFVAAGFSGNRILYTSSTGAEVSFRIGGGTAFEDATTGFVVYVSRFSGAAPINVCYTRESTMTTVCSDDDAATAISTANTTGVLDNLYGFSFYGLAPLTIDGLANETYTVTITNTGTTSQFLVIDAVAVIGRFGNDLLTSPTDGPIQGYDDTDARITYAPGPLWATFTGLTGFVDGTVSYAQNAGALAQVSLEGNTLTVYPLTYSGGSGDVRFCLVLDSGTQSSTQCSNFSLNTAVFGNAPITLYGFGFGQHDVIIENRDPGKGLAIDAYAVD